MWEGGLCEGKWSEGIFYHFDVFHDDDLFVNYDFAIKVPLIHLRKIQAADCDDPHIEDGDLLCVSCDGISSYSHI